VVSTIELGSDVKDVFSNKLVPEKLSGYKSKLESIGKDIDNRIDNTLNEMISLSNTMDYYKTEESRNTVSYKMLDQKWNIRRDRLWKLQDDQKVVNHEIQRVTIAIYENPIINK